MKALIGLITLFIIFPHSEKDATLSIHKLRGTWKIESENSYETWEKVSEKELKGSSYKMKDGKKITAEFLSVKIEEGKTVYTATVIGQNNDLPVDFVLNAKITNKLSFENPTHDFPKKIQYTIVDDKTLFVEVLGENDKGFSYKMVKQ